jgi:hypothetical protein
MAEPTHYLVVCSCTGQIDPIAFIDDDRLGGGTLTIAAAKPEMKQIISAIGYHPQIENWRAPDGFAADTWANYNVTEIILDWEKTRRRWIVRCLNCNTQAQMSDATLQRIADKFDAGQWGSLPSLEPSEPIVQSWNPAGWAEAEIADDKWRQRHLVKLGVLVDESQGTL